MDKKTIIVKTHRGHFTINNRNATDKDPFNDTVDVWVKGSDADKTGNYTNRIVR